MEDVSFLLKGKKSGVQVIVSSTNHSRLKVDKTEVEIEVQIKMNQLDLTVKNVDINGY